MKEKESSVLIVDIDLPDENKFVFFTQLKRNQPRIKVLFTKNERPQRAEGVGPSCQLLIFKGKSKNTLDCGSHS